MYLLDGVPVEIYAPRLIAHQRFDLSSSFCGSGLSNIEHCNSSIAAAIFAVVANEGPFSINLHGWSLIERPTMLSEYWFSLAPSKLRPDLMAPMATKQKLSY